jgi:hypothetical protein
VRESRVQCRLAQILPSPLAPLFRKVPCCHALMSLFQGTLHGGMSALSYTSLSPRNGAFAPFVRPTPQSDSWRHDRGRIVS